MSQRKAKLRKAKAKLSKAKQSKASYGWLAIWPAHESPTASKSQVFNAESAGQGPRASMGLGLHPALVPEIAVAKQQG